jgi:hypothetical protein
MTEKVAGLLSSVAFARGILIHRIHLKPTPAFKLTILALIVRPTLFIQNMRFGKKKGTNKMNKTDQEITDSIDRLFAEVKAKRISEGRTEWPINKKLRGCNAATGKCEYCPAQSTSGNLWLLHNDDHINVCEKDECIDKGFKAGYVGCGCGG